MTKRLSGAHLAGDFAGSAGASSSSAPMRVLVTGASGFAGSLLIPRLASEGHEVRALGRDPARVREVLARSHDGREAASAPEPAGVEVVRGDVLGGAGLERALAGVEVAYYLIHSMERPSAPAGSFADRERLAAKNFAAAADQSTSIARTCAGVLTRGEASTPGWSGIWALGPFAN